MTIYHDQHDYWKTVEAKEVEKQPSWEGREEGVSSP
jgi:hypothetical protein